MNDSTTSRFRSNFNTDPSIWKVTKHHGTTLRIVDGVAMIRQFAVARFQTTRNAVATLKACGWRVLREEGDEAELRAD